MEEHPQRVRRITALKETRRGRMAVFFDGEFDFSVDDETLLRHDLKVGKQLDEREYERLREQTQYQKAKEKAFSLLSRRSYPGAQLRQKLEGDFSPDCIDRVMERCAELGLIDDLDYAQRAARDLVHLKHYSLGRVRQELARRGIGPNEIEDALEQFADYDERQALRQQLEKSTLPPCARRRAGGELSQRWCAWGTTRGRSAGRWKSCAPNVLMKNRRNRRPLRNWRSLLLCGLCCKKSTARFWTTPRGRRAPSAG